MTRYQLQQSVYSWLHRANFRSPVPDFDAVPTFIDLAEQDINLDLRTRCMMKRAVQTAQAQYVPLPCDYLEATDIRLVNGGELLYRSRSEMADMRGAANRGAWTTPQTSPVLPWGAPWGPQFYTVVGELMELTPYSPPPDPLPPEYVPYTVEMNYYGSQTLGPNDADTTAVLTTFPGAYLWGSLVQSAPFLRNDERIATWQGLYQSTILRANALVERANSQGSRLVAHYRRVG